MVLDLERLVPEWQWLLSFATALKSTEALTRRSPFPESFNLLNREIADRRPETLVSIYIFDIQYALIILPVVFWTGLYFGDKRGGQYSEEEICIDKTT